MDHSEDDGDDDDDENLQVKDDDNEEGDDDDDDDDDEALVFEASENMEEDNMGEDGGDDDDDDDDENVQVTADEQELPEGEFEMGDDSLVNENQAMEMEALMYEYKPHDVEHIALNEDDEEEVHEADDEDASEEEEEGEAQEGEEKDAPEDSSNVQLSADEDKFFSASMNGHGGLGESVYERVIPAKYADGGDSFMASMIENYALEQKNEDGSPNGRFFMDEATTR
jgi:hypothetical protein